MLYEIVNPSDRYTIRADEHDVAAVACFTLGGGKYAFEPLEEGGQEVPIFFFGGHDEWCQETFGKDARALIDSVMETKRQALIDCLESCLIGGENDRREFEEACALIESAENRAAFKVKRHEGRRTSMNDIGARARGFAETLRARAA